MKRYVSMIAVAVCSLALLVFVGCAGVGEALAKGFKDGYGTSAPRGNTPSAPNCCFDESYWRMEHEIEKSRRRSEELSRKGLWGIW